MSKAIEKITAALVEVGACWAVTKEKCVLPCDGYDAPPAYHIHPGASYPHTASIRRFETQAQIWRYIEYLRKVNEAYGAHWNETNMASSEDDAMAREWEEVLEVLANDYEEGP